MSNCECYAEYVGPEDYRVMYCPMHESAGQMEEFVLRVFRKTKSPVMREQVRRLLVQTGYLLEE